MKRSFILFCALASASAQQVKVNEIQLVGSHNSYHSGISPNEFANLQKMNPRAAAALEYKHPSLETQLNDGVRQLEIDVYADTKGGLFAHPQGPVLAAKAGLPADPPFDPNGIMMKPGFKVLHVEDIDYRSNCEPFTNCLTIVRNWSKAHPGHLPIFILVENKDGKPRLEGGAVPEPLTAATFDALDAEIRSVFQASEMITPDDVRGAHKTLNEAILANAGRRWSTPAAKSSSCWTSAAWNLSTPKAIRRWKIGCCSRMPLRARRMRRLPSATIRLRIQISCPG